MLETPELIILTLSCVGAGFISVLMGLGGGFLLVPLLTVFFDLPIHKAIGTSFFCIIVTSQASALAKPSAKYIDLRLGIILEIFTVVGVLAGGLIAFSINQIYLKIIFSVVLFLVFIIMLRKKFLNKNDTEVEIQGEIPAYEIKNLTMGYVLSVAGGLFAGMLGVGGGFIKVPIMRTLMGIPFKVAASTSMFMIGITAGTGALFYGLRTKLDFMVALPCFVGMGYGAYLGALFAPKIKSTYLEIVFTLILVYFSLRMLLSIL